MNNKIIITSILIIYPQIISAETYKLIYSINDQLCSSFKMSQEKKIPANKSITFTKWEKISNKHINEKSKFENYCWFHELSVIDINNDGGNENVLRRTGCLSGIPSHDIFVYKNNITKIPNIFNTVKPEAQLKLTGSFYKLSNLPKIELRGQFSGRSVSPAIGGMLKIIPFKFKKSTYLSMSAKGKFKTKEETLHVITKYTPSYKLKDQCYFKVAK